MNLSAQAQPQSQEAGRPPLRDAEDRVAAGGPHRRRLRGDRARVALLLAFGLDQPVRSIVIDGPFQRVSAVEVQQAAHGRARRAAS